jgi:hypothetical protein
VILAGRQRIGVALADHDQLGPEAADAVELCRRGHIRHEDRRFETQPHRGEGDGSAVVAAGRGNDPDCRHFAGQQIGEGAARLE